MRIAITGASGRVGRAVIALAIEQGHEVVSIDRVEPEPGTLPEGVTVVQANITDYAAFEAAMQGCDALIHLAAYPSPGGHPDYEVHNNNVVGSYNALSAAARLGIKRACQASSINAVGAVYSRKPRYDYFPLDEQHPTYNEDPYSLSKWICEAQAESCGRRRLQPGAALRLLPARGAAPDLHRGSLQFIELDLRGAGRFVRAALRGYGDRQHALPLGGAEPRSGYAIQFADERGRDQAFVG